MHQARIYLIRLMPIWRILQSNTGAIRVIGHTYYHLHIRINQPALLSMRAPVYASLEETWIEQPRRTGSQVHNSLALSMARRQQPGAKRAEKVQRRLELTSMRVPVEGSRFKLRRGAAAHRRHTTSAWTMLEAHRNKRKPFDLQGFLVSRRGDSNP